MTANQPHDLDSPPKPPQQRANSTVLCRSNFRPPTNLQMSAICLLAFTTGLAEVSSSRLIPLSPPLEIHVSLLGTSTSFILGSIMAAALAEPVLRSVPLQTILPVLAVAPNLLAPLLDTVAVTSVLLLPGKETAAPFNTLITVLSAHLRGFTSCLGMTVANLLCTGLRGDRTTAAAALGAVHGLFGLGIAVGLLLTGPDMEILWMGMVEKGSAADGRNAHRLQIGTLVLGVIDACVLRFAFRPPKGQSGDDGGGDEGEEEAGRSLAGTKFGGLEIREHTRFMMPTVYKDSHGFPPPASRTTILGALFAFAYQAGTVIIPVWAVSVVGHSRDRNPLGSIHTTLSFQGSLALGQLVLFLFGPRLGERRIVTGALVLVSIAHGLVWLVLNDTEYAVPVAVFTGLLLAPVYPCALAGFLQNLSERERVSGVGIITGFANSGLATALLLAGSVEDWISPLALQLISAGTIIVMLLCWHRTLSAAGQASELPRLSSSN